MAAIDALTSPSCAPAIMSSPQDISTAAPSYSRRCTAPAASSSPTSRPQAPGLCPGHTPQHQDRLDRDPGQSYSAGRCPRRRRNRCRRRNPHGRQHLRLTMLPASAHQGADIIAHSTTKFSAATATSSAARVRLAYQRLFEAVKFYQNNAGAIQGPGIVG